MINRHKISTLEQKFPLLSIEGGYIISKDADITAAFRVEMPELFTVTGEEYEAMHATWHKAIKVLPNFCIVHKQDWFITERYKAETGNPDMGFFSRANELHFNERPFLNHDSYLFITKTNRQRMMQQSNFSTLCRGNIIPKELHDGEGTAVFREAVEQFCHIMNVSGYFTLTRLDAADIAGDGNRTGLLDRYFSLCREGHASLEDIRLGTDEVRVGDNILCLHTLSDTDDLPSNVSTDIRYERLSTDRSDCKLSFAAPVGLLLSCNHIYNQYIFIDDSSENLSRFEKQARNMHSLARYSRANQINREWLEEYMNIAHSQGLTSVRAHFNVLAWSDDRDELKHIKNDVGSALAMMECKPRHNTVDTATLYWAAMPGNEADFPSEESFYTFIDPALCFFTAETNYKDSLSPFGIKMVDRLSGKPVHLDISDLPMERNVITNRNKFILGPSGSGKSYFTNHMIRQYYEQGTHVLMIDTGNSYKGLCELINLKTKGEDGIYLSYEEERPISFNPFYVEDGIFDIEKKGSIKALIFTLWKRENQSPEKSEDVLLDRAIALYLEKIKNDRNIKPCFNTFYEFMDGEFRSYLEEEKIGKEYFDLFNFLLVLGPYYKGGIYDFLLNSDKQLDLQTKRFIVFELDNIKDNPTLLSIVTIIIMETFISKMRKLKGIRKMILLEEAWKAISKEGMAEYLRYLFKTVRKFFGEAVVVTQEVDDIINSPIVKESIINNSDCKILLDQRKYMNKFDIIQNILGLTEKERSQILSINQNLDPNRKYKEVWIGLGGTQSAVYGTEVSAEEDIAYSTEEKEKVRLYSAMEKCGGNIELAIRQLAEEKRTANRNK